MATYKDDLDILKAAEKADTNKLTFNAITELDNKGLLGRYGEEEESGSIDLGITGASAGEYAKIKTVDANGVPTAWESGAGGGGGVLVVGMNIEIEGALNKTWKEIHDAAQEQAVVLSFGFEGIITQALLYQIGENDGDYYVEFFTNTTLPVFSTNNENGYPVANEG